MDRVDKYKRIEDNQQQEKGKLRLSPKKDEILGRIDTTIIGRAGIMQSSQGRIITKWSGLYSENQCIKYWKKSRTSPSSNGPIRWWEILKSETETFTVNIIRIMAIKQRIAGVYGITWTNLSEREN